MSEGTSAIAAVETPVSVETPVETQTPEVQPVESQTETQSQETQNESGEQQPQGAEQVGDLAGPVKKAIETLKSTDPAAARALRDMYFQQEAFKKDFPGGLKEVKALKAAVDELGGADGIQAIQAEKSQWSTIDQQFATGDPAVLETFAKQSPEGFAKLIPAALDKLAQVDKPAYDRALSGVYVATLDSIYTDRVGQSVPLGNVLDAIVQTLAQVVDDNGQPLLQSEAQALQKLSQHYAKVSESAKRVPAKVEDKAKSEYESKLAELRTKEQQQFRSEVDTETQSYAATKYESLVSAEVKTGLSGLPEKGTRAYANFMRELDGEVAREMAKRPQILQKLNSFDATGKKKELVSYLNAQFDQIAPDVVKRVAKEWGTSKNPVVKKPVQAAQESGPRQLSAAPAPDQIDYSKWPSHEAARHDVMNRRAYLKGRNGLHTW